MKRAIRIGIFLVCIGFAAASVANVFGDNSEVVKLAQQVACDATAAPAKSGAPSAKPVGTGAPARPTSGNDGPCALANTRMERTPFGQSFDFSGGNKTQRVKCTRAYVMVGEYACVAE